MPSHTHTHTHIHTHTYTHTHTLIGMWNWLSTNVFPYIIDWMFILVLGMLMALLSFAIDYLIDKINEGIETETVVCEFDGYSLLCCEIRRGDEKRVKC